jgi:pilus assembly protein CpaC
VQTGTPISGYAILALSLVAVPSLLAQGSARSSEPAGASIRDSSNDLSVTVGKSVLIDCGQPTSRVAVGMSDVAEATAVTPTEIMVNGKAPGETSLIIWDTVGSRQFFNVTVRPTAVISADKLESIRHELNTEFPGHALKVTVENNSVFLRGTVKDLTSSARAVQIASTLGKVVNLLNVEVPVADPQILLKVRFASVDRSKIKQLGLNFIGLGLANTVGGITTGQFSPPNITNLPPNGPEATFSNELNILVQSPGNLPFGLDIQALENDGVVEVLAQPNLLAANGKQASFLAGGEYPYPVVQGSAASLPTVTIMFKEYGVRLNFIPTITPRGSIRLQVAPEVSALDFTNAVQLSGFNVPAITTRKVKTEVELNDGQSFLIGGLLDDREFKTFEKVPFLGDIPILGKFFQSYSKTRINTELMVFVTPVIVAPIAADAALPALKYPEEFLPPNSGIPMHNPDAKTAANTPAPVPKTLPVEKLIESMRPETPLLIEDETSGFGAASSSGPQSSAAPSAPQ